MKLTRTGGAAPLAVIAGIVVVLLALYLIAFAVAELKVTQTQEGWRRMLGSDDVRERHFVEGPNAAALELERLAAVIGVDLVPRGEEAKARRRATGKAGDRLDDVRAELQRYVYAQLQRPETIVAEPSDRVAVWLAEIAEPLAAVRRCLGEPPRWGLEIPEDAWATPLPNLLGHLNLQKVLLADALAALAASDRARALEDLEASWNLSGSIRNDPILINQLIALAGTRYQVGLLRKLDDPPATWSRRLGALDLRSGFKTALQLDGWAWSRIDALESAKHHPVRDFLIRNAKPYARFCIADLSDDYRRAVAGIDFDASLCDAGIDGSEIDLSVSVPGWNLLGENLVPHLNGALGRLARLELDIELTRHVLGLGDRSDPTAATWPSAACPDSAWVVAFREDGTREIALDRQKAWPDQKGVILPTRYVAITP